MQQVELDVFSSWLSLAPWLVDSDGYHTLLVKLLHGPSSDGGDGKVKHANDVEQAKSKTGLLVVFGGAVVEALHLLYETREIRLTYYNENSNHNSNNIIHLT